ncbi:MAG: PQQ-dependent sugar dehydrogenase [Pseudomonadota bacterium]|nr:PQQ-dependent sugar dehydrogenase [Gammaproteobacteria bacterium]MDQ3583371.1 PQQ-dependent sugar dehydrogenase [Pseudomonadota bacterium]
MERPIWVLLTGVLLLGAAPKVEGITLPPGFSDTAVAEVASPTALAFTPEGRLLIAVKPGRLWVYQNGVLSPTPALDLTGRICTDRERGLLGVAVHPGFAVTSYVYLYPNVA